MAGAVSPRRPPPQKYFLITNDLGNPIYFSHPNGRLICPLVAAAQLFLRETFQDSFRVIRCGATRVVVQVTQALVFLVSSNQGEPEHFLRRQLYCLHDLLVLRLGPSIINMVADRHKHLPFAQHQETIQVLLDTYDHLCSSNQSVLVQSLEWLEINEDLRSRCTLTLEKGLYQAPAATCALLFVGTKLVAQFSKPKFFDLSSVDIYLLNLYVQSIFRPHVRRFTTNALPVADYENLDIADDGVSTITDEGYVSAEEFGDDMVLQPDAHPDACMTKEQLRALHRALLMSMSALSPNPPPPSPMPPMPPVPPTPTATSDRSTPPTPPLHMPNGDAPAAWPAKPPTPEPRGSEPRMFARLTETVQAIQGRLAAGLGRDSAGPDADEGVALFQYCLSILGHYKGVLDGVFGEATHSALCAFQEASDDDGEPGVLQPELGVALLRAARVAEAKRRRLSRRSLTVDPTYSSSPGAREIPPRAAVTPPPMGSMPSGPSQPGVSGPTASAPIPISAPKASLLRHGSVGEGDHPQLSVASGASHEDLFLSPRPQTARGHSMGSSNDAVAMAGDTGPSALGISGDGDGGDDSPAPPGAHSDVPPNPLTSSTNPRLSLGGLSGASEASSRPDDEFRDGRDDVEQTFFEQLHLRPPQYVPCWVYATQIAPETSLVVISPNAKGSDREKERMHNTRKYVQRSLESYLSFLVTKGQTHVTMLSYLHQFPGLVHFVFVDRTSNQVIAPTITPLHQSADDDADGEQAASVEHIKSCVWNMCHQAQRHLAQGYTSMFIKSGGLQCSYRMWLEDTEGNELPIDQPQALAGLSLDSSLYRELVKRLYPSVRGVKCYELYTLYLSMLSSSAVASHNRSLAATLMERR